MKTGLLLLFAIGLLAACSAPTPTPEPPTATASPAPSLTPSPTTTYTPSPTFTATPRPTRTPTPRPSATPPGFYLNTGAGFSLTYPRDWVIEQDEGGLLVLRDSTETILFLVGNMGVAGQYTLNDVLDLIVSNTPEFKLQPGEISLQLADEVSASARDLALVNPAGVKVVYRAGYLEQFGSGYLVAVTAPQEVLEARGQTLERILASLRFLDQVYGLERAETLVLLGGDPDEKDLDPARMTGSAAEYAGHLYSGLVRLNPQLQIEADLAESWTVSPDGTVYTFTLRAGLEFASGDPLTAQDVKFSWERAAQPKTKSTTADTYLGDILGVKEMLAGKADELAGVEVMDDRTLRVTLDGPKPYFLAKLTYPTAYVVNGRQLEANSRDWPFEPDASGPFSLREYIQDEVIIFERNPSYHTPAGLPYVVYIFNPGGAPLSLYEAGRLDMVGLGAEDAEQIRRPEHPRHAELLSTTSLCTTFIYIDRSQPPMDDPQVRQAFLAAVDRPALLERFGLNLDLPASSILPPAMPGFSTEGLLEVVHDPDAARAALQASGYAGRLPPVAASSSGYGGEADDLVTAVIEMWRETLGVEVEVDLLDPLNFSAEARQKHGQMVFYGWCADYPDPQNFLDILFHSQSEFNVSGYANPEVDSLLEQASIELDPARRLDLYHQAERLILADLVVLPLRHGVGDELVNPRVKGYVASPMGVPIIHLLTLEAEE